MTNQRTAGFTATSQWQAGASDSGRRVDRCLPPVVGAKAQPLPCPELSGN